MMIYSDFLVWYNLCLLNYRQRKLMCFWIKRLYTELSYSTYKPEAYRAWEKDTYRGCDVMLSMYW